MEENIFTIEYILENELDKKAYGFIYITTNLINGKKYIGQKMFASKSRNWKDYLGSGSYFLRAIKKCGKENFIRKIIAIAYSREELDMLEINFIRKYNAVNNKYYYNISQGGNISNTGICFSDEHKQKISNALKGKQKSEEHKIKCRNANKGNHHTEDSKRKISEANSGNKHWNYGKHESKETTIKRIKSLMGRKLSLEHKVNISKGSKGHSVSIETRDKISKSNKGKIRSKETKQKLSESHKGKRLSKETREKISKNNIGRTVSNKTKLRLKESNSVKVICLTTNEIYNSIIDAEKKYWGKGRSSISACCSGKLKSSGKHPITGEKLKWMYYDEYIKQQNKYV